MRKDNNRREDEYNLKKTELNRSLNLEIKWNPKIAKCEMTSCK